MSKFMQWYYCGLIDDAGKVVWMSVFREVSLTNWSHKDYNRLDALDMLMGITWLSRGWYVPIKTITNKILKLDMARVLYNSD